MGHVFRDVDGDEVVLVVGAILNVLYSEINLNAM